MDQARSGYAIPANFCNNYVQKGSLERI